MKKITLYLLLMVLLLSVLASNSCKQASKVNNPSKQATNLVAPDINESNGLNRHPSHIKYSKHAQCRMACRHIDASEIQDILENGTINYKKSELQGEDCSKKYAVEGYSKDNQHLRIIFAPCTDEVTVVTCIDIGREWACDCK
jgi:hypothetical protein